MVVPASARVRLQAEAEGLDQIFQEFGAEWRNAGCSMCLGMNPDQLTPGERSASTSNRNFEGRQGKGGRTHLVSPLVAAATAIRGTLSSLADLDLPSNTTITDFDGTPLNGRGATGYDGNAPVVVDYSGFTHPELYQTSNCAAPLAVG